MATNTNTLAAANESSNTWVKLPLTKVIAIITTVSFLLSTSALVTLKNNGDSAISATATSSAAAESHHNRRLQTQSKTAVVTMVDKDGTEDLCLMLKSLLFLKGGYGGSFIRGGPAGIFTSAPVLIFNEGNLSTEQMQDIEQCTSRPVAFPVISLKDFPADFKRGVEWEKYTKWTNFRPAKGRNDWSYAQMLRFWTAHVFKHPAVQQFDTIMKIDADSCFLRQRYIHMNPFYQEAPGMDAKYAYQTNYDGAVGGNTQFVEGLYEYAVRYMETVGMTPANPKLWSVVKAVWEQTGNLPVFQTNFEICRLTFFKSEPVAKWLDALADEEPYGLFRYRWSDANTRVLTLAMFAKEDELLLSKSTGYLHGKGRCAKNFIADVHDRMKTEERW